MTDYNSKPVGQEPNLYEIFLLFSREWKLILKVFVGLMVVAILGYGMTNGSHSKRVSLVALGGYVGDSELSHRMPSVNDLVLMEKGGAKIDPTQVRGFVPFLNVGYVERQIKEKFGQKRVSVEPMATDMLSAVKAKKRDKLAPYRPAYTIKLALGSDNKETRLQVQKILSYIDQLEQPAREEFVQRLRRQIDYNERVIQGVDVAKHYKVAGVQDTINAASVMTVNLSVEKLKLLAKAHKLEASLDSVKGASLYLNYTDDSSNKEPGFFKYFILVSMMSALVALILAFVASVFRQQARNHHQG